MGDAHLERNLAADMMRVSELFGPTIQGEGPTAGQRAAFIRLVDCNLDCRWCDTPYTWDWSGRTGVAYERRYEFLDCSAILERLRPMNVHRVVVTGGEPLLRQLHLTQLAEALTAAGYAIEVETNGTLAPTDRLLGVLDRASVSPKLASACTTRPAIVPDVLRRWAHWPRAAFKFVVSDRADLDEVHRLVDVTPLPTGRVWLMPQGATAADQLAAITEVADAAIAAGYNFTARLHTLAWGNTRGR